MFFAALAAFLGISKCQNASDSVFLYFFGAGVAIRLCRGYLAITMVFGFYMLFSIGFLAGMTFVPALSQWFGELALVGKIGIGGLLFFLASILSWCALFLVTEFIEKK